MATEDLANCKRIAKQAPDVNSDAPELELAQGPNGCQILGEKFTRQDA